MLFFFDASGVILLDSWICALELSSELTVSLNSLVPNKLIKAVLPDPEGPQKSTCSLRLDTFPVVPLSGPSTIAGALLPTIPKTRRIM